MSAKRERITRLYLPGRRASPLSEERRTLSVSSLAAVPSECVLGNPWVGQPAPWEPAAWAVHDRHPRGSAHLTNLSPSRIFEKKKKIYINLPTGVARRSADQEEVHRACLSFNAESIHRSRMQIGIARDGNWHRVVHKLHERVVESLPNDNDGPAQRVIYLIQLGG